MPDLVIYTTKPPGAGHTERLLTHPLDISKGGLAVNASAEIWKPVVGYEGYYEVSNLGRVRGLDRVLHYRDGRVRRWRGRIMKQVINRGGYPTVGLTKGDQKARYLTHRLVLEAFVGSCPVGMEGCHSNGNPADNRLENLRWDTHSANNHDIVRHGNHHQAIKTHCKYGHEFTPDNIYWTDRGHRHCRLCACHPESKKVPDFKYDGKTHNSRKTHCKRGHEFTAENTYVSFYKGKQRRQCKECTAIAGRAARERRRPIREAQS